MYDVDWGTDIIRLLVLNEVPAADRNAILNLFSAEPKRIVAGVTEFRERPLTLSSVLEELLSKYQGDADMNQTLDEMLRDSQPQVIARMPVRESVEILPEDKLQELQDLITKRLVSSAKKPAASGATKVRRKTDSTRR